MKHMLWVLLCCTALSLRAQIGDFNNVSFARADSVAASLYGYSLKDVNLLAYKLTAGSPTEVEKFRAIYKWVCDNITYDYASFTLNRDQRRKLTDPAKLDAWNKKIRARVFKNLVDNKTTVCTGYAYIVKALANQVGLTCEIVDGYGRNSQANLRGQAEANHSWNAVRLNNRWYLCDPTWSSGVYNNLEETFVKQYNDNYFLADPNLFVRNHYPLDKQWMLVARQPTLDEFLTRPLVYSASYKRRIDPVAPGTFDVAVNKGESSSFSFSQDQSLSKCRVELRLGSTGATFTPDVSRGDDGLYRIDYTFHARGPQTMHVLVDGEYAFTYRVTVK